MDAPVTLNNVEHSLMPPAIQSTSSFASPVLVVGQGRLGEALAASLGDAGHAVKSVSARKFLTSAGADQDKHLKGCVAVLWCGQSYRDAKTFKPLKEVLTRHGTLMFVDFSDSESCGASATTMRLERELSNGAGRVWCVREVGAGELLRGWCTVELYGGPDGGAPKVASIGLQGMAFQHKGPLVLAARHDAMVWATVGKWKDSACVAFATFVWTFIYAVVRYHETMNGKYGSRTIPMYLFDKALCWAALLMMSYSMFAGNVLTLRGVLCKKEKQPVDWLLILFGLPPMIFAVILCLPALIILVVMRAAVLPRTESQLKNGTLLQLAIDVIMMPGELGLTGWFMAFTHGFLGALIAGTRTYKAKWFAEHAGDFLGINYEASMTCGAVALSLLFAVALRTALGKAPWVQLKYFYHYATALGLAFATAHVVLMGYKGWSQIFRSESHNGQPSITWVSSMFPVCVLFVWFMCKAWKAVGNSTTTGISSAMYHTRDLLTIRLGKATKGSFLRSSY